MSSCHVVPFEVWEGTQVGPGPLNESQYITAMIYFPDTLPNHCINYLQCLLQKLSFINDFRTAKYWSSVHKWLNVIENLFKMEELELQKDMITQLVRVIENYPENTNSRIMCYKDTVLRPLEVMASTVLHTYKLYTLL